MKWRIQTMAKGNFAAVLQSVFEHSFNRMLDHIGMLHMLLSGVMLKGLIELQIIHQIANKLYWRATCSFLIACSGIEGIHSARSCTVSQQILQSKCKYYMWNHEFIIYTYTETHVIQCGPIESTKVRCWYDLVNT